MKCDCCGRRKRVFESFAEVEAKSGHLNLCADCNDMAYKVRDAVTDGDCASFDALVKEWDKRSEKGTSTFTAWRKEFIGNLKVPETLREQE